MKESIICWNIKISNILIRLLLHLMIKMYRSLKYQKEFFFYIKSIGRRTIIRKFKKQLILSYEVTFPNCTPTLFKFFCNKSTSNLMHWRWLVIINKVVFVLNHSRHWVSHTPPRQEHQSDPNLKRPEIHQRLKTTTVWKNHFYHESFEHFHSGKPASQNSSWSQQIETKQQ